MSGINIFPELPAVSKAERTEKNRHQGTLLWFTGLSGSGKSTIAKATGQKLFGMGVYAYILDGDNIRNGLNSDLGFSDADRAENIRRVGEVGKLFADAGLVTIAAFISPFRKDRDSIRAKLGSNEFIEIYLSCPIEECESRDVKGLYARARKGEISEFTGMSSPYEAPTAPELVLDTSKSSIDECTSSIISLLKERKIINEPA